MEFCFSSFFLSFGAAAEAAVCPGGCQLCAALGFATFRTDLGKELFNVHRVVV